MVMERTIGNLDTRTPEDRETVQVRKGNVGVLVDSRPVTCKITLHELSQGEECKQRYRSYLGALRSGLK
jgi:hypothetical protein